MFSEGAPTVLEFRQQRIPYTYFENIVMNNPMNEIGKNQNNIKSNVSTHCFLTNVYAFQEANISTFIDTSYSSTNLICKKPCTA